MKSSTRRWKSIACAVLIVAAVPAALLFIRAFACGPDFESEVFVPPHHPASPKLYADGHLGILQRSYYHAELVIAYRYLTGSQLSEDEKAAFVPRPEPAAGPQEWQTRQKAEEAAKPVNQWRSARAQLAGDGTGPSISPERTLQRKTGNYSYQDSQLNCTDGAFANATSTLQARAKTWGAASPQLKEWLRGQDAVFANCEQPASLPSSAQPEWPVLLRQDRAYQIAAAEFYAMNFDGAIKDFEGIGRDQASPWSRWGEYLAARSVVRKAADGPSADDPGVTSFNLGLLRDAQARLLRITQHPPDAQIRHAAEDELGYVLVRVDPSARLDHVSVALAGPKPDPEFAQDLTDLDFLMDRQVSGDSDLAKWVAAMQGIAAQPVSASSGSRQAAQDAKTANVASTAPAAPQLRRQKQTLPWLIAALSYIPTNDPAQPELMAAAANLTPARLPTSPQTTTARSCCWEPAGSPKRARCSTTCWAASIPTRPRPPATSFLRSAFRQRAT